MIALLIAIYIINTMRGHLTMTKLSNEDLLKAFKEMTLLELSDFVKQFEDTFDITSTVPVATNVNTPLAPVEVVEEQSEFNVILENAGDKKIGVIKVVREIVSGLGLKEAKDMVDSAPKSLLNQVSKEVAENARTKLESAGASVTIK